MQALQAFWAKNLGNKLIVVAVVGLLCCCPVSLARRGEKGTPAAVPTAAAAAAEQSTTAKTTEEPTEAPASTKTLVPTKTPAMSTAVPTEAPASPERATEALPPTTETEPTAVPETLYASRGLGLSRAAWEELHGKPTRDVGDILFYGSDVNVMFFDNAVWNLSQSFGDPGISVSEARDMARLWLPKDAKLLKTYTSDIGQLVDLYHSPSLVARFPSDNWVNGKPGDHVVIYRHNDGSDLVFGIVIGTGNNP